MTASLSARRAWIEIANTAAPLDFSPSLSARRAWIEMIRRSASQIPTPVALRKESVDRNDTLELEVLYTDGSLSARRAWIEIAQGWRISGCALRSLSARRAWIEIILSR